MKHAFTDNFLSFNFEDVIKIGIKLLEQVELLHTVGYLHCDLKCDNVMLDLRTVQELIRYPHRKSTHDTSIHLIDFGEARIYETAPEKHVENFRDCEPGNVWFASKNNLDGDSFSRRDDVI